MNQMRIRILSLMIGDMLVFAGAAFVCSRLIGAEVSVLWPVFPSFLCIAALIRLYHGNIFNPGAPLPPVEEIRRAFFSVTLVWLLAGFWLSDSGIPARRYGLPLVLAWGLSNLFLIPVRTLLRRLMKKCGVGQTPVLIAGGRRGGHALAKKLERGSYSGYRSAGFLDDSPEVTDRLGTLEEACRIGRKKKIDTLLTALPPEAVMQNLRGFSRQFRYIQLLLPGQIFPISWAYPVNIQNTPGIELQNQLLLPGPRALKACFELFLAILSLCLLWPLLLGLSLLVKLSSPGPVLYRAKRIGRNGKPIEVWKFRTMYQDADKKLDELLNANPELAREWNERFKLHEDPRVTPVGRFLRKTSLDELPQIFNVLRGEMSVIGPRPIVKKEIACYAENYESFCRVKPGITGLWQVSGRSDTTYEERVAFDMYYIFNWSVWQDLYILALTVDTVLRQRGAR